MRKNRLAAFGIAALMTAAVAACGASSTETKGAKAEGTTEARTFAAEEKRAMPAVEAEQNAGETEESKAEEAAAEELKEIDPARPLHLESGNRLHSWHDPAVNGNGYMALANVMEEALFLSDDDAKEFPELEKTLRQFHEARFTRLKKELVDNMDNNKDVFQGYPDIQMSVNGQSHVRRADTEVLSFVSYVDMFYGGVHPDYFYGGYNFDTKTGKEITLADVISDASALPELLDPVLSAENGEKYDLAADSIREILKEKKPEEYSFTIEPEGIRFWFSPYDLSSFAAGMFTGEILFKDHPEIFTGKYQNASPVWARACPELEPVTFFRDGKRTEAMITTNLGEYGGHNSITVSMDGKELVIPQYGYVLEPHLLCRDGKYWLYLFNTGENDFTSLHVLDMNGSSPKETGTVEGISREFRILKESEWVDYDYEKAHEEEAAEDDHRSVLITDPDNIRLDEHMELLSTYSASAVYVMQGDGVPENKEAYYEIYNGDSFRLTLKQDAEFPEVDPETLDQKGTVKLPAGTEIGFYRTDGKDTVWFLLGDGRCIRVKLDDTDWPQPVKGTDADELFDGMIFAG